MMPLHRALWFFVLVALGVAPGAYAVEIAIATRGPVPVSEGPIEATLTAVPFGLVDRNEQQKQRLVTHSIVPGRTTLDLPKGQWRVSIDVRGYFADAKVAVGGTDAPPVDFALWPTGFIEGELAIPKNIDAPSQMHVRFAPSDPKAIDAPPESFSICELKEKKWRCEVAAGRIDVRLRATRFMTQFRSALDIKAGKTLKLGVLRLETGSSVVGFVTSDEKIDVRAVKVMLTPLTNESPLKAAAAAITVPVRNVKGLFEFRGVATGQYKLFAWHKGLSSDEVLVLVRESSESELRDPLILAPARSLRVSITPARTANDKPWHVTVTKELSSSRWETVTEGSANEGGLFEWSGLRSDRYGLSVGASSAATYAQREFNSGSEPVALSIDVPETRVRGTVRLGSHALAANVIVGGAHRSIAVPLAAGADGEFSGVVPFRSTEMWDITVQSDSPHIERSLRQTPKSTDDGELRLDLVLPAASVSGTVVDPEGKPLNRATVNVESLSADEGFVQIPIESDGSFLLVGLSPGSYKLQAWSFDDRASDLVSTTVSESGEGEPVTLVVHRENEVVGRIVSRAGPVQGARVWVYPTDVPVMMIVPRTTGPDGQFRVTVPPGCKEGNIAVNAAGFSFKTLHLVLDGRAVTLVLDQTGGTIDVDVPNLSEDLNAPQGFLLHRGSDLPMYFFASSRDTRIMPSSREGHIRASIPLMEPGDYALCRLTWAERNLLRGGALPPGRCSIGTLASFGTLTLATP